MASSKVKNKIKLSILIPVYNHNVQGLVGDLVQQCEAIIDDWEIILLEDGSDSKNSYLNAFLAKHPQVQWHSNKHNRGRAKARNELAQMASGNYLLFLDADSQIIEPLFLQNYLQHLPTSSIICGGRNYSQNPPKELQFLLHWHYGNQRESKSMAFMSNNFLIPQSLMLSQLFDADLQQYGHEDTLFGQISRWKGVNIEHIDNPILHAELETAEEFLQKSKHAVQNLWLIKKKYPRFHHPIITITLKTQKWKLSKLFIVMIKTLEGVIRKNLTYSRRPYLVGLDLLKWMWSLEEQARSSLR